MKTRKIRILLGMTGLLILSLLLFPSCQTRKGGGKDVHVMLVLSYDSGHYMYREFLDEVKTTLASHGYQEDIRTVYMDMENTHGDFRKTLQDFRDSLRREHWNPELMLFEGDRPARLLITAPYDTIFDFNHTPIVLGALHHPNAWANLQGHTNIARWSDPMDFCRNIDLAVQLTGVNCVNIELDQGPQDLQLRQELKQQISRPPYVDNMDFHETRLDDNARNTLFKDSILIHVFSTQKPWENHGSTASGAQASGKENLMKAYSQAWKFPQLVVKKDVYADLMAIKSGRPQFTAVKSDFGNGTGNYLAGYFASYRTIAHDITETGIKILEGTPPGKIEMKEHQKAYWMDYTAMKKLGMKYEDYAADFQIINGPAITIHRYRYMAYALAGILGILLAAFLLYLLYKLERRRRKKKDLARLEESIYITQLCQQGADSHQISSLEDIQNYLQLASAGQENLLEKIEEAGRQTGKHTFKFRGKIREKDMEDWWELNFVVRKNQEINGVILNVSEREQQKKRMGIALQAYEESQKKEDFMIKTSREISEPLEAIKQCCDKLTEETITPEQKQKLSEQIGKDSELLTGIINDILLFSRIESGRQQYFIKEINMESFIHDFLMEWKGRFPEYLKLNIIKGRPDALALADKDRLRDILNQFMSNAIKFTDIGSINIGWCYYLGKNQVEVFIEDTGVGISERKRKIAFSLFWKANNFMPGVGLGLNIAKRLAENMDGKIVVSSQEGVGSRFSVWIKGSLAGSY